MSPTSYRAAPPRVRIVLPPQKQEQLLLLLSSSPPLRYVCFCHGHKWLVAGPDLNRRPSGYEPDELPSCSTPRPRSPIIGANAEIASKYPKKVYSGIKPSHTALFCNKSQFFRQLAISSPQAPPRLYPLSRAARRKARTTRCGRENAITSRRSGQLVCNTLVAAIWAMMRPHRVTETTTGPSPC